MKITFLTTMLLLCMGLTAANISPEVEFDGNGYINDVEREKAPDMKEPEVKKKKVVKKKKPIKKSVTSSVQAQSFQADQYSYSKKTSPLVWLAIGIGAFVVIGGGVGYVMMNRKPKIKKEILEDFNDIVEQNAHPHQQSKEEENPQVDPLSTVVYKKPKVSDDLASATKIDEYGRNPSGIIVDEDKYFASGKDSFVDEDFSG